MKKGAWTVLFLSLLLMGCADPDDGAIVTPPPPPTATIPSVEPDNDGNDIGAERTPDDLFVVATDAPLLPYTDFNQFGEIVGFNNALMAAVTNYAGLAQYEFVVTPAEGILTSLAAQSNDDFDAVMANLLTDTPSPDGVIYTRPYLEIGQVLMVLADEQDLQSYEMIQSGSSIAVARYSSSVETAETVLGISTNDLLLFDREVDAIQALINETADAVLLDHYSANYYAQSFPEQLKIVGGNGRDAWIDVKAYHLAVAADDVALRDRLDEAIQQVQATTLDEIATAWLVVKDEQLDPGESRVGTPANELIIGVVGQLTDMDPISPPTLIDWELKQNTMSGLYRWRGDNRLEPLLASGQPTISEDKLSYTVNLRQGLRFPDGTAFSAEDVQRSILRAARLGSGSAFLINNVLKDSNEDNFADEDAVLIVDEFTVQFLLQEPTPYFTSLLATPPYFPVSECYAQTYDAGSRCGGIGPYTIVDWDETRIRLTANPQWPGQPEPAFTNIQVRFYEDPSQLRRALESFQSVDIAWNGFPYEEFVDFQMMADEEEASYRTWLGPATFKSYLMFEQSTPPWDEQAVRQAVSYAIDREALAIEVFAGQRIPLLSPIPDAVPGHTPVWPARDVAQAQALLNAAGYTVATPLDISLWYVQDGRYSDVEAAYANAIKAQLEETGIFRVTVIGEPFWEQYRAQVSSCGYSMYLLGWPTPGQTTNYLDATSWTDFFIENTDRGFCTNYESEAMTALQTAAQEAINVTERNDLYAQIQRLWAEELPTLDLVQAPQRAVSLTKIDNIEIDAMGFLHYELLTKRDESNQ